MNEEQLAENIARELARVYAEAWKQALASSILTSNEWASANWQSFCGEAWDIIEKTRRMTS